MHFRRTGQRDERRRRVLMEDPATTVTLDEEVAAAPSHDEEHTAQERTDARYSRDVLSTGQPRITDLIPTRRLVLWAAVLAGLIQIAAVAGLYHLSLLRPEAAVPQLTLAVLNPQTAGSLGAVLASLTLALTALACCLVYAVRRHKVDDYRGEYRWWIWVALVLGVVSLDACTHISVPLGMLAAHFSGLELQPHWWTLGAYYTAGGLLGLWFFVEFRRSATATTLLLVGLASLVAAGAWHVGWRWHPEIQGVSTLLWQPVAYLLGTHCLALSVWTFARRVRLEAEGQLPALSAGRRRLWRRASERSRGETAAATSDSGSTPSSAAKGKASAKVKSKSAASAVTTSSKSNSGKADAQLRRDAAHDAERDADENPGPGHKNAAKKTARVAKKSARVATKSDSESKPKPEDEEQISPSDSESDGLSRSERRRLRKLQRRQRT